MHDGARAARKQAERCSWRPARTGVLIELAGSEAFTFLQSGSSTRGISVEVERYRSSSPPRHTWQSSATPQEPAVHSGRDRAVSRPAAPTSALEDQGFRHLPKAVLCFFFVLACLCFVSLVVVLCLSAFHLCVEGPLLAEMLSYWSTRGPIITERKTLQLSCLSHGCHEGVPHRNIGTPLRGE